MRKHFVGKAFKSIIEMDNSVVMENIVAEANVFFSSIFVTPKQLETTLLFSQKILLFISDMSEMSIKVLTLMSNLIANEVYRRNV